jgi:Domain of unknown function (DUF4328)/Protein of unknown function (DUF2510)
VGYPPSTTTPPGWYPDPWYPQSVRYWDGSTWTAHAQSMGSAAPRVDPESVRGWGRKASIAFLVQAGCGAFNALLTPYIFGKATETMFDALETGSEPDNTINGGLAVGNVITQITGLVSIAAAIMIIVWSHHITTTARALGLRTTHTPGWAIAGWLVPIINFWYPYQIVRDALPEDDEARALVPGWWALYLGSQLLLFGALIAALLSPGVGLALGAVVAVGFVGSGVLGRRLALAIAAAHEARARSLLGAHP